jgi:hypothetical protein
VAWSGQGVGAGIGQSKILLQRPFYRFCCIAQSAFWEWLPVRAGHWMVLFGVGRPKAKAVVLTGRLLYPLTARQQRRTASYGDIVSGQTLKIGTRKSAMALAQTDGIARLLRAADPALDVEIVKFETRGDQDQTSKLLRHGGKGGAFVAEIREAMRAGQLQAAMHSLKDVPGNEETPGLIIAAMLPRDAANDALVLRPGLSFDVFRASKGKDFKIGTNAVRRAA